MVFIFCTGMGKVGASRYLSPDGRRRGAQVAGRGRQVVSVVGCGGFSMLMGDFLTLVQYGLPVKVVLFGNSSVGMAELEMAVSGLGLVRGEGQEPGCRRGRRAWWGWGTIAARCPFHLGSGPRGWPVPYFPSAGSCWVVGWAA